MRYRADFERSRNEALRNVAIYGAVLHNRVTEIRGSLPDMTNSVACFDASSAVAEAGQTENAEANQESADGAENGYTEDQ